MNIDSYIKNKHAQSLRNHDKIVFIILLAHLPVTMFLIPWGYDTQTFALVASLAVGVVSVAAYFLVRGTRLFGLLAAVLLMALSAIMIQTQMGRIEMHFHIFGAIALLLIYRDWLVITVAAGAIAVHHLVFTALQLNGAHFGAMPVLIYDYGCSWGIAFLHAAFVVFEAAILIYYTLIMKKEELTGLQLMSAVTEIQRGHDLSIRLPVQDHDEVPTAFNSMIDEFDQLIKNLSQASQSLLATSDSLSKNSEAASSNIAFQHEQIEQAVMAMSEMSKTIHNVAENSTRAADAASDADQEAQRGEALVNHSIQRVSQLVGSMQEASGAMEQLEVNVGNIGSVVDVIRGISEQTNLLALNAAIEAARAGEQGRGFAVVADEVRTLASRTQESTEEIQKIIQSLQDVTSHAVDSINSGRERTLKTTEEINQAGTALKSIVASISAINSMNMQIASAAEEQASVADSVSENIDSIARLSNEAVSKVSSNLATSHQLQSMSSDLQQSIGQFR